MDNYRFFQLLNGCWVLLSFSLVCWLCFDLFKCLGVVLFCVVVVYCWVVVL